MCGICGEIRFDDSHPEVEALKKMSAKLVSRGPDAGGMHQMNHLAVAHRRLKIIDLSEHAQQPMVDNQLGLGIVFNGCIYNYQELRTELRAWAIVFFSDGRYRGHPEELSRLGYRLRRPFPRYVRLRHLGAGFRQIDTCP